MTDINPQPTDYQSFSSYLRDTVTHILAQSATDSRPISELEHALFNAINAYLTRYSVDEEPIDFNAFSRVPHDFANQLFDQINLIHLNQGESFFNTGPDAETRITDRDHNRRFGDMLVALGDYMEAYKTDMQVAYHTVPLSDVSDEDRSWKLWQRCAVTDNKGQVRTSLESAQGVDFSKKCYIVIGDANCVTQNRAAMAGQMKLIENLLGGKDVHKELKAKDEIAIYGLSHPTRYRPYIQAESLYYNADPEHFQHAYTREVFDLLMKPQVDQAFQGGELNMATLRHVLSQFNFMTSSSGAIFVKTLSNLLASYLEEKGLDGHSIKEALASVYVLSLAPAARIDDFKKYGNFSTIHVVSRNDHTARSRGLHDRLVRNPDQAPQIVPVEGKDNEIILWTEQPESGIVADLWNQTSGAVQAEAYPPERNGKPNRHGHNPKIMANDALYQAEREDGSPKGEVKIYSAEFLRNAARHAVRRGNTLLDRDSLVEYLKKPIRLFEPKKYWVKLIEGIESNSGRDGQNPLV